ncbi:AzlD domain-containing protein [Acinetobacter baumannii]|uniref:AzlD domain-containing protein n=2 Tax=Acinetobacter baumannii TaxID=470 RepID=UPI00066D348C|nr:AzlD domain-containing protein [Acinetobacter baumannii]KQE72000.1 branched-chain amino acid transporter [Acinetobacter baumannii]MCG9239131.1 AzlD domain-containing protein [Acinetobacter baumannii]MDA3527748.1 AzlD domain-containing protein [Acinetobacter baumannii]MDA3553987.1 AzlD domain-containing protein [Acinetobacter baumannii]MDI9657173.1 AzlD domain-containing protein [Acinetobacter baumannii]
MHLKIILWNKPLEIGLCNKAEPNVKVKLPVLMNKMLNYSAPCLLSAICIPVIFFENNELRGFLDNPYLYATIFCIVVAFYFKKVLLSVLLSLAFFYVINFIINH